MSKSTKREILTFVERYSDEYGTYPTLNEIKEAVGLKSTSTVHKHIKDLVESKALIIDATGSYSLTPVEQRANKVPVIGFIAAGAPIEVVEDVVDHIDVADLPKHGDFYALKVKGDSMIDDGVFDGDIVIIKRQTSAQNGQTVVAIIDENKATLKKIYKEDGKFRLQPANQSMLPLIREDVEVRGVVWSIHRDMNNKLLDEAVITTRNWKTVDLFAGVGGIRLGFEKAGFTTVFANDFEGKCADTYDCKISSRRYYKNIYCRYS